MYFIIIVIFIICIYLNSENVFFGMFTNFYDLTVP